VVLALVIFGSLGWITALYLNAERHRQLALHREQGALALTQFYKDNVLTAPRAKGWEGGRGKDVSLKEALDLAAPKIEAAFAGQPELEATVRDTLDRREFFRDSEQALASLETKAFLEAARSAAPLLRNNPGDKPLLLILSRATHHMLYPDTPFDPAWEPPGK